MHRELDNGRQLLIFSSEGIKNGVSQPAFGPMILDCDQLAAGGLCRVAQGRSIDRLDRVGVDHARGYPFALQLVVGLQRLDERDTGCYDANLVIVRVSQGLASTDLE